MSSVPPFIEFAIRSAYFRCPSLISRYQSLKIGGLQRSAAEGNWNADAVKRYLDKHVPEDADVMVHSSMAGIGKVNAGEVVSFLLDWCADRTLLMPTHPILSKNHDGTLHYDPKRCMSRMGFLSEVARRRSDFSRSLHPLSSVAVRGPRAAEYLKNNLNHQRPLPHGEFSPYARLSDAGGFAVCLGVPFFKSLSMLHVAEETLDARFPRRLVFDELTVAVGSRESAKRWVVRERSRRMLPHLRLTAIRKDLVAVGAVKAGYVNGIIVDICNCKAVVEYMKSRALEDGYPYMFLRPRRGTGG